MKKICQRMCICCRQMKDRDTMVRVVKDKEKNIFIDNTGKADGRGAYICNDEKCIQLLKKNKSLNRVFKCNVDEDLYEKVKEVLIGKTSKNQ